MERAELVKKQQRLLRANNEQHYKEKMQDYRGWDKHFNDLFNQLSDSLKALTNCKSTSQVSKKKLAECINLSMKIQVQLGYWFLRVYDDVYDNMYLRRRFIDLETKHLLFKEKTKTTRFSLKKS